MLVKLCGTLDKGLSSRDDILTILCMFRVHAWDSQKTEKNKESRVGDCSKILVTFMEAESVRSLNAWRCRRGFVKSCFAFHFDTKLE